VRVDVVDRDAQLSGELFWIKEFVCPSPRAVEELYHAVRSALGDCLDVLVI
jgi:hypothetical protein